MYVIKKLRLNRFRAVPVPRSRVLYRSMGYSDPKYPSQQTAENIDVVLPMESVAKTKTLALAHDIAEKAVEFAENPQATSPLQPVQPKHK